jgi:hypothetical protein
MPLAFFSDSLPRLVSSARRMKNEALVANYNSEPPGKGEMVFTENATNGILKMKIVFEIGFHCAKLYLEVD